MIVWLPAHASHNILIYRWSQYPFQINKSIIQPINQSIYWYMAVCRLNCRQFLYSCSIEWCVIHTAMRDASKVRWDFIDHLLRICCQYAATEFFENSVDVRRTAYWQLLTNSAWCRRFKILDNSLSNAIYGMDKKVGHKLMTIILSNLNRFKKITVKWILKLTPHLAYVATLPCETLMSAKQATNDKLQGSVFKVRRGC